MKVVHNKDEVALQAPEYAPVKENEQVLLALGLTADHIAALPMIVKTGAAFLLQEVRNQETLTHLQPPADNLQFLSEQYNLAGYCIFCRHAGQAQDALAHIVAFPGTEPGVSACALACYLYDIAMIKKDHMVVWQINAPVGAGSARLVVDLQLQGGKIVAPRPAGPGQV